MAICTASDNQRYCEICSDGAGGAIITWRDYRSGSDSDIYAQIIDSSGNVQWTANGVAICTASNGQYKPKICSDGAGGAIITWEDSRSGSDYDIYAQRIVDINSIYIASPENKTYVAPMNGYYPATYGFENDADGSYPKGWEEVSTGGGFYVKTISNKFGHNKVLEGYDKGNGAFRINYYFNNTEGTIEFWMAHTTTSSDKSMSTIIFDSTGNPLFGVVLRENNVKVFTNTGQIIVSTYTINTWYHLRFDFRSNLGNSYEGLNQNEFKFYFNGDYNGTYGFDNNGDPDYLWCRSTYSGGAYYSYWDAFGYSWDPNYNIGDNLNEGLLLSFTPDDLDWMGYSLDNQPINTILGNSTIPMPEDGHHTIQVFGVDSIGGLYESDIRHFTIEPKNPEIVIHSPNQDDIFGVIPPKYNISIVEVNLVSSWYTIDDGVTNNTFTGLTGTINQTEWEKLGHGLVNIRFYANNTVGKEGQADVIINKDLNAPISIITFIPHSGTNIVNRSTTFSLSANDGSESGVLSIRYQINDSVWIDYTGSFNLSEFSTGDYIISYYAIDTVGNLEVENTLLVKLVEVTIQEPLPDMTIIIIASTIGGIGLAIVITIILIRKRK